MIEQKTFYMVIQISKHNSDNTDAVEALKKLFLLISLSSCALFLLSYSIEWFALFLKLKQPSFVLQKPSYFWTFENSPLFSLTHQYEQHTIKFIVIYFYSIFNQISEARNILVLSLTVKSSVKLYVLK